MTNSATLLERFRAELLAQVITALSGGLLTVLLARMLDRDSYGVLFLAISVFGIVMVFTKLGIARSAGRYISEYKETDPNQVPHIVTNSLGLNLVTIVIVGAALSATYPLIASYLDDPSVTPLLALGGIYVTLGTITYYCRLTLQGFESIEHAALVQSVDRVFRLLFAVGFVILGYGAVGALWGYLAAFAASSFVGLALLYLRHYSRFESTSSMEAGLRRRIAEYSIPISISSTANVVDKRVDIVLVGYFLNPAAVSYYVIGKQVTAFLGAPMKALGFTLSPTFGSKHAQGNDDAAQSLYESALVNTLLIYVPAGAGLALVAEPFVLLVFGGEYLGAVPVLQLFSLYVVVTSVSKISSNALDYLGKARLRAYVKTVSSLLNGGLNLLLIPWFGVRGAAIATIFTGGLYAFCNVVLVHQTFGLDGWHLLNRTGQIALITAVMSACVFALVSSITSWFTLLAVVGVGVGIWASLATKIGMLDPRDVLEHV